MTISEFTMDLLQNLWFYKTEKNGKTSDSHLKRKKSPDLNGRFPSFYGSTNVNWNINIRAGDPYLGRPWATSFTSICSVSRQGLEVDGVDRSSSGLRCRLLCGHRGPQAHTRTLTHAHTCTRTHTANQNKYKTNKPEDEGPAGEIPLSNSQYACVGVFC